MAKATNEEKKTTKNEIRTGGVFVAADVFNNLKGERFAGLNILKLNPGEAAGPLTLKEILLKQDLTPAGSKRKKKMDPVDVYIATGPDKKIEIRMPIAASFIQKAKDAKLSVGDVFYTRRGDDYVSQFKTRGQSYEITVTQRKGEK